MAVLKSKRANIFVEHIDFRDDSLMFLRGKDIFQVLPLPITL
jgi:hypothetical protein